MSTDFKRDMAWSHAQLTIDQLWEILKLRFPNCVGLKQASDSEDRKGTDYWLVKRSGGLVGIDVKIRKQDCRMFGVDDVCVELHSGAIVGWSLDTRKACDYIAWIWSDTKRAYIVGFSQLLAITALNAARWREAYGSRMVANPAYETECVFVPIGEIEKALAHWQRGELT